MKILNVRPSTGRPIIAWFDIELEPGIRIYNVSLKRNGAGELRVYASSAGEHRVVTFDVTLSDRIIEMAEAELGSQMAYGVNSAA